MYLKIFFSPGIYFYTPLNGEEPRNVFNVPTEIGHFIWQGEASFQV